MSSKPEISRQGAKDAKKKHIRKSDYRKIRAQHLLWALLNPNNPVADSRWTSLPGLRLFPVFPVFSWRSWRP